MKMLHLIFQSRYFAVPVFFQKMLIAKSNNIACLEHLTETVVDENGEEKFVLCDIHVGI